MLNQRIKNAHPKHSNLFLELFHPFQSLLSQRKQGPNRRKHSKIQSGRGKAAEAVEGLRLVPAKTERNSKIPESTGIF